MSRSGSHEGAVDMRPVARSRALGGTDFVGHGFSGRGFFAFGLLALAVVMPLPLAAQNPAGPQTPPCQAAEHRQFDFWLGVWEVKNPQGQYAGTNRIERILNGCVLLENWEGNGGSVGKSFNMYYGPDREWRQTWVDGQGGRLDLAGGLEGADMVLRGETPAPGGARVRHEIRWTPQGDGSVKQHWRSSSDGGTTWADAFVGIYRKK